MDIVNENISLEKLTGLENISVRSSNICECNGLNDLFGILNYYWKNGNFLSLRNCESKSNTELITICLKYENYVTKPIEIKPENSIEKLIQDLTPRQRKILNNLIDYQSNNLSVRSINAVAKYSNSNLTLRGLNEIIINPNYDLGNIKNIGEKSVKELAVFFKEIREQIEIVNLFKNDYDLIIELFNTYLRRKFNLTPRDIVQIWSNYESQHGLPVFKTIDYLFSNGHLLNKKEYEIFKKSFNFWTDYKSETLENISTKLKISRERTRQVRNKILDNINLKLSFLKSLEFDALNLYGINNEIDIISVNNELVEEIQQKESVNYNHIFITKVLSLLLNQTHSLVGDFENCAFRNNVKLKGASYLWKSIYLVKSEIKNVFDFESLVIDIKKRLSERITDDYSFHFETYLTNFIKGQTELDFNSILSIAEHIIFSEFELIIDLYDNITFQRNTLKPIFEYSYEALKALGKPSKIEDIFNKVQDLFPEYQTDENKIRASIQSKYGFVSFGRNSIWGLVEWKNSFKSGSMHDIAEEFLVQFETPKHIGEITNYVSQYRPTVKAKNLLYNLKSAENRRFVFFRNNHIGLVTKRYGAEFIKVSNNNKNRRTWDENFKLLSKFANDFNRLPLSSGNEEEQKIYRFLNIQLNKISKNLIDKSKTEKVNELITKFGYVKGARRNIKEKESPYVELTHFIKKNKRLPKANIKDEKKMYYFYYRQTKLYAKGELLTEQEIKYIKLNEIIRNLYGNDN